MFISLQVYPLTFPWPFGGHVRCLPSVPGRPPAGTIQSVATGSAGGNGNHRFGMVGRSHHALPPEMPSVAGHPTSRRWRPCPGKAPRIAGLPIDLSLGRRTEGPPGRPAATVGTASARAEPPPPSIAWARRHGQVNPESGGSLGASGRARPAGWRTAPRIGCPLAPQSRHLVGSVVTNPHSHLPAVCSPARSGRRERRSRHAGGAARVRRRRPRPGWPCACGRSSVVQQLPQQFTAPGIDHLLQQIMRQCCRGTVITPTGDPLRSGTTASITIASTLHGRRRPRPPRRSPQYARSTSP
jgi:hypothetical protein